MRLVPAKNKMDHTALFLILLTGAFDISSSMPRQFYYVKELMTWQEAQSYCRANYVDLATVDSLAYVTALDAAVKGMDPAYSGAVWIGLKRNWAWSTGDSLNFNPTWDVYQPNEGNGISACLVLFSGAWGDYPCSFAFNFYCYDASPTASNKFIHITSSLNWTDAQLYCKQHYTDLALVNNAVDAAVVSGSGWIGLISSHWSDGAFSSYRYWAPGNAESSVEDKCGAMSMSNAAEWISIDCNLKLPFSCYGGPQLTGPQPTGPQYVPRQYHYVDYQKTWLDAQTYCKLKFTDLATLDSINDVNRVMNEAALGASGSLWIGLSRSSQTLWGWSRGDDPLDDYYNWDAGRPNGSGACVVNINSFWRDYNCNAPLHFVCYNGKSTDHIISFASTECYDGTLFYHCYVIEGTGYIMVQSNKTWLEAQSYCRSTYNDLATVRSPWEQKQLMQLVGGGVFVWIGLFQDTWKWSEPWSLFYRNWAVNQPSPTAGDCTAMATSDSGKWSVQDCNTALPFICYADKKVLKKTIIRIKLSYGDTTNLNDPLKQAAILKEIENKYIAWRKASFGNLRWNVMSDGNVFGKQSVVDKLRI